MVLGPVIDRSNTVVNLRYSHERLNLIVQNAKAYAMVLCDAEGKITDWLAGAEKIFGWSANEMVGQPISVLFTAEDRASAVPEKELDTARRQQEVPDVRWHLRKDGIRMFIEGQTVALKTAQGKVRGFLKIGQDVTERKRSEELQATLLAELQHRVRNVLTTVRSVAVRTALAGGAPEDIAQRLAGRIDSLARTQALLAQARGVGVELSGIVRREVQPYVESDGQALVEGPPVELGPAAAEVMTLAVHELATNALKYGAFGKKGG
jgi:PAS domain S-box-containing protein